MVYRPQPRSCRERSNKEFEYNIFITVSNMFIKHMHNIGEEWCLLISTIPPKYMKTDGNRLPVF